MRNEQEVLDVATRVVLSPDDHSPPSPRDDSAGDHARDAVPPDAPAALKDDIPHEVTPEIKKAMLAAACGRQLVDRLAALQNEEVTKYTGISRSELGLRVWNAPMADVAKRLGLKQHVLRRICRLYEVPTPPKGYFQTSFAHRQIRWTRCCRARNAMTAAPPLYEEHEVLERLQLRGYELGGLLNVGIIAPVAGGPSGEPRYCAETIDRLAVPQQRGRLSDALWWDFDLKRPSFLPADAPWARAIELPFYPFDDERQQSWAHRYDVYPVGRSNNWVKKTCAKRETLSIAGFDLDGGGSGTACIGRRKGEDHRGGPFNPFRSRNRSSPRFN